MSAERDDILRKDAARGARAETLLNDPLLVESLTKLETDYIAAWKATPVRDTEARERLWQAVQIVGKVENHLRVVADGGKMARAELDEIARLGERRKFMGVI